MLPKNHSRMFIAAAMAVFVLALAAVAAADSFHYKNILIGERAAGMGGAYTAISDDPSGMFYNPAGIVFSHGANISAGANAYHNTTKTYKSVIGGNDWKRRASTLLPNFFGVVQQMGDTRLGISYVVPDSVIEDQDQYFSDVPSSIDTPGDVDLLPNTIKDYTINFNNEDNTYNFGLSIAHTLGEDWAAGLTLYYHKRRIQTILNQYLLFDTGESQWQNSYYESEENGVKPILGIMWTPADKIALGLSVSKVIVLDSTTSGQTTVHKVDGTKSYSRATTDEKREYPTVITLGAAYFPTDATLYSADVSYHTAEKDKVDGERVWVLNAALGTEHYFSPKLAVRAGIFTNMSSAPEIKAGKVADSNEHVDIFGGSASLTHFGKGSSLTLGLSYSAGKGKAQISDDASQVQDMEIASWTLFLSNSYGF